MRRLALLLVGLVAVYVLADLGLRRYVEWRVENEFDDATQLHAEDADFTIDSFPFAGRLLLTGEVSATLTLHDVGPRAAEIDQFGVEVDGLVFDRDRAFSGEVLVTGLDQATVTATFEEETLSQLFGVAVDLAEGSAQVGGVQVQAAVTGGGLQLTIPAVGQQTVAIPARDYFPCEPSVAVTADQIEVSCTTTELPPVVNDVIGRAIRG